MGIFPACKVAMRDASLSVATTSCPASARQLPETSPTYPHPITANFTLDFPLLRPLYSTRNPCELILAQSHGRRKRNTALVLRMAHGQDFASEKLPMMSASMPEQK